MIIAFEGADGLGKTTQAKLLAEKLHCRYIKFPNEDKFSGKRIRELLNFEHFFEPASFQALQIVNRLESLEMMREAEASDGGIILDRFSLSGIVYGLVEGLPEEWLREVIGFLPTPDLTFLFVGEPYTQDRDVYGDTAKQARIAELYLKEAKTSSGRIELIHNGKSIEAIHEEILGKLRGIA